VERNRKTVVFNTSKETLKYSLSFVVVCTIEIHYHATKASECANYGIRKSQMSQSECGPPKFMIPKDVLENLIDE
jgi:hypothetical protein